MALPLARPRDAVPDAAGSRLVRPGATGTAFDGRADLLPISPVDRGNRRGLFHLPGIPAQVHCPVTRPFNLDPVKVLGRRAQVGFAVLRRGRLRPVGVVARHERRPVAVSRDRLSGRFSHRVLAQRLVGGGRATIRAPSRGGG